MNFSRAEKQRRKVITGPSTNLNQHHHHTKVEDNTNKKTTRKYLETPFEKKVFDKKTTHEVIGETVPNRALFYRRHEKSIVVIYLQLSRLCSYSLYFIKL
jgi:hypothetical protein